MNTLITHKEFIKMRDSGKFSKKFKGKHSYFLDLSELDKIKDDENYVSPPPAPRYKRHITDKYFNKKNIPNKYNINITINHNIHS